VRSWYKPVAKGWLASQFERCQSPLLVLVPFAVGFVILLIAKIGVT
jgi:hypothetical protein